MTPTATGVFIVAVIVAVIAWDVTAFVTGGAAATISDVIRGLAKLWPWLPYVVCFAAGMLAYHLFYRAVTEP
jgi:hypothetical protein